MTPNEFFKYHANPHDVIAITCYSDWDIKHLENLLEQYHQCKLKLLNRYEPQSSFDDSVVMYESPDGECVKFDDL